MEQYLSDALVKIVGALIGLATSYAIFFISKAQVKLHEATAQKVKDENQRTLIDSALNRVSTIATNVVARTEQTLATSLRESIKDGKIDKAELEVLGKQAVQDVYGQLTEDTKLLVESEVVDIQKYIEDVVEKAVLDLKTK